MKLSGNTVLITGGSSGIGLEIAKQFLNRNNTVIITGRNEQKLQKAKEQLKGVTAIQSDVSNPDDIKMLHQRMVADFPDLNVLINNAGIMRKINLQDHNYSALELGKELDVNVKGPIWMTDAFLPLLKEKTEAAIVNVSSMAATIGGRAGASDYAASKAAVDVFSKGLAKEVSGDGIRVNVVRPGMTLTDMTQRVKDDPKLREHIESTIPMQ